MSAFLEPGRLPLDITKPETCLDEVNLDSLEVVAVVLALETRYSLSLDNEVESLTGQSTLGDIHTALLRLLTN